MKPTAPQKTISPSSTSAVMVGSTWAICASGRVVRARWPATYAMTVARMKTTPPTRVQDVKDPVGRVGWPINKGRDGERTPMQWDGSPNAGFTSPSATPWLPIPPSYKSVNVALESRDDDSLLNWYRQWISLRRANPALRDGALTMLNTDDDHVLSWLRQSPGGPAVIVACNFTAKPQTVSFDLSAQGVGGHALKTLIETPGSAAPASLQSVRLPPFGVYAGQVE